MRKCVAQLQSKIVRRSHPMKTTGFRRLRALGLLNRVVFMDSPSNYLVQFACASCAVHVCLACHPGMLRMSLTCALHVTRVHFVCEKHLYCIVPCHWPILYIHTYMYLPGVIPPISAWCPLLATKNTGLSYPG